MKVFRSENNNELLLAALELNKRRINKRDPNNDLAVFHLSNVDFKTLLKLYSKQFPIEIQEVYRLLSKKEESQLTIPEHILNVHSKVIRDHTKFNRYNELYTLFNNETLNKEDYDRSICDLNSLITNDILSRFKRAVLCTKEAHIKLAKHIDTLFAVCIFFYNKDWDSDGTSYNGPVSVNNSISDLETQYQPHFYRAHEQTKVLSNILLDYFEHENTKKEVNIKIKKMHIVDDPSLADWIVQLLITSIKEGSVPISLDYFYRILNELLKAKDNMSSETFLQELRALADMQSPNYIDVKRKEVKKYCLAIHPIFSHYLERSIDSFNGQRSKIYHNILKTFYMDDFNDLQRESHIQVDNPNETRANKAANRLGELLRRKEI